MSEKPMTIHRIRQAVFSQEWYWWNMRNNEMFRWYYDGMEFLSKFQIQQKRGKL